MLTTTSELLRAIISLMQIPVIVILIALMLVTIVILGGFLVEIFTEHRQLKEKIPELIDRIKDASYREIGIIIRSSAILKRQKVVLDKLIRTADMSDNSREAYAMQLLFDEEEHYRKQLRLPEIIMKVGPMLGLLGTLIPLGPGLMALGKGDTATLSKSLLIAFDTTSAGVGMAAVAFVIFYIKRSWYRRYAQGLESLMEVILERKEDDA